MGEVQEVQLQVMAEGVKESSTSREIALADQKALDARERYKRWFKIVLYTVLVLAGQAVATLLGRLYFDKGGKSKWLGTLVRLVGFPILLPFYYFFVLAPKATRNNIVILDPKQPSALVLASVYILLGLLVALNCYLSSIGLMYLPVSTFSLIGSSNLGFNALFSYFMNHLKFTASIINSLVLLTISSTLLALQSDPGDSVGVPKGKYVIGFVCTVMASAGAGLFLSLNHFAFRKIIKKTTVKATVEMVIFQSIAATCVILVGLFASGEWKGLKSEMEDYKMGKASYILNLTWSTITWQLFSIGSMGLIMEVSSIFSNAIGVVGLPIIPIMAVVFFHDKMHGVKAIALVLAVWGFVSYMYQHYLDDCDHHEDSPPTEELKK
ncbi:hypothetical protein L6164_035449 [Bauhinia variegata]|uniref:Uncharacterized protein n=1 Tax=Bauhinia variegata TaxID=167791 RepID=A0ACB9KE02_BAUVA|nr:hypothetical protein L6164_035449 [Bauhinia variegata]